MANPLPIVPVVQFRFAQPADIPELTGLIELSISTFGGAHYSAEQLLSSLEHVFGVDQQLIADETYYVAHTAPDERGRRQLVGCGGWSRRRRLFGRDNASWNGDPAEPLNPAIEPARIRAFFVHPDWARRGIARELLRLAEHAARAHGFRAFELAATLMGEEMCTRCGFIELERIDYELPDGVRLPMVRMLKPLTGYQRSL